MSAPVEKKKDNILKYLVLLLILIFILFFVGKAKNYYFRNLVLRADDMHISSSIGMIKGENANILLAPDRYYTNVKGQGVFFIPRQLSATVPVEWKKLISSAEGEPVYLHAIAADGEKALILDKSAIKIINLKSLEIETIVAANVTGNLRYTEACWSGDGKYIYAVKEALDQQQQNTGLAEIIEINVLTGDQKKLTEGTSPSLAKKSSVLVFARDGMIWSRDLKTQKEQQLTQGRYPAISPDGNYVAYVQIDKKESVKNGKENLPVNFEELYIFSLQNPQIKLRVSDNLAYSNLNLTGGDNSLSGYYNYYKPQWDGDSQTIFVIRRAADEKPLATVYRYKLVKTENEARPIVYRFLDGRINKDREVLNRYLYANFQEENVDYFFDAPSFSLEDSGWMKNGLFATVRRQYVENEGRDYHILNEQIYLDNSPQGYRVKDITPRIEFSCSIKADGIYKLEKGEVKKVVDLTNVTEKPVMNAYNFVQDRVVYCVPVGDSYEIRVFNEFNSKTHIIPSLIPRDAWLKSMTFNRGAKIIALQYSYQGKNCIAIYNLEDMRRISTPFLEDIQKAYWTGNEMVVYSEQEDFEFRWDYNPGAGSVAI